MKLSYEAYESMARELLVQIGKQAQQEFSRIMHVAIVHRLGDVEVGEASIAVAVSSPHRLDAFVAVPWIMDQVKARVPVWKMEVYEDGSVWKQNKEWKSNHCCRR